MATVSILHFSGDKFNTLQYFHTLAMQHGMIWIGLGERPGQPNGVNRLGSWGGAMAQPLDDGSADVVGALVRGLIGKDLTRVFELSGNRMIVKAANPAERWRVAWERYDAESRGGP